jgi:hypothetical protein
VHAVLAQVLAALGGVVARVQLAYMHKCWVASGPPARLPRALGVIVAGVILW